MREEEESSNSVSLVFGAFLLTRPGHRETWWSNNNYG